MEELNIPAVLERLAPYMLSPMERVLAAHTGTVQLLLSLYFGEPVDVLLVGQKEKNGQLMREASLTLRHRKKEACRAHSAISLAEAAPEVLSDVRAGFLGLGQIAVKHGIPTTRAIRDIRVSPTHIVRCYEMRGPGLLYVIRERFPRRLYGSGPTAERWAVAAARGVSADTLGRNPFGSSHPPLRSEP